MLAVFSEINVLIYSLPDMWISYWLSETSGTLLSCQHVCTGSGVYPAHYSSRYQTVKAAYHSPLSTVKIKNAYSYTSFSPININYVVLS